MEELSEALRQRGKAIERLTRLAATPPTAPSAGGLEESVERLWDLARGVKPVTAATAQAMVLSAQTVQAHEQELLSLGELLNDPAARLPRRQLFEGRFYLVTENQELLRLFEGQAFSTVGEAEGAFARPPERLYYVSLGSDPAAEPFQGFLSIRYPGENFTGILAQLRAIALGLHPFGQIPYETFPEAQRLAASLSGPAAGLEEKNPDPDEVLIQYAQQRLKSSQGDPLVASVRKGNVRYTLFLPPEGFGKKLKTVSGILYRHKQRELEARLSAWRNGREGSGRSVLLDGPSFDQLKDALNGLRLVVNGPADPSVTEEPARAQPTPRQSLAILLQMIRLDERTLRLTAGLEEKAAVEEAAGAVWARDRLASVAVENKALILGPQAMGVLQAASHLVPTGRSSAIPVAVIVENARQAEQVKGWALDLPLLSVAVVDASLPPYNGSVETALEMTRRYYASEKGMSPIVATTLGDLPEIAAFLGLPAPDDSVRQEALQAQRDLESHNL